MPLTNKKSRAAGFYESTCCNSQIKVGASVRFPTCRVCKSTAVWLPIDRLEVTNIDHIEEATPAAAERRGGDRRSMERRAKKP